MTNSVLNRAALRPRTIAVLDAFERAFNEGDVAGLDAVLAPFFTRQGHNVRLSRDELKTSILEMRESFPDLRMDVLRVMEGENDIAVWWNSHGTLNADFLGLPPSGRTYSVAGVTFSTFAGNKITAESVVYDHRGEHFSLGVPLRGSRENSSAPATMSESADPDAVRAMHRQLVTGVTVVTVDADGEPRGLAVNAFSSVSLEPPLILVCVQKTSSTYPHLIGARHFAVNILAADQAHVAQLFATKRERKFDELTWHSGELGAPLIDGAAAAMEAESQDILHARTHTIFIGRIMRVAVGDRDPLIYTAGAFFDGSRLHAADTSDS